MSGRDRQGRRGEAGHRLRPLGEARAALDAAEKAGAPEKIKHPLRRVLEERQDSFGNALNSVDEERRKHVRECFDAYVRLCEMEAESLTAAVASPNGGTP